MAEVVYLSRVHIERVRGPLRRATLPAEPEPVWFSTHSEVRDYYGGGPADVEERATTLDYVVAAAGG